MRKLMLEMRQTMLHLSQRCNELSKRLDELSEEQQSKLAGINDDLKTLIAHRFEEDKPSADKPKSGSDAKQRRRSDKQSISFRRDASGKITHADVKDDDE